MLHCKKGVATLHLHPLPDARAPPPPALLRRPPPLPIAPPLPALLPTANGLGGSAPLARSLAASDSTVISYPANGENSRPTLGGLSVPMTTAGPVTGGGASTGPGHALLAAVLAAVLAAILAAVGELMVVYP